LILWIVSDCFCITKTPPKTGLYGKELDVEQCAISAVSTQALKQHKTLVEMKPSEPIAEISGGHAYIAAGFPTGNAFAQL
jgi:hypothetical protein